MRDGEAAAEMETALYSHGAPVAVCPATPEDPFPGALLGRRCGCTVISAPQREGLGFTNGKPNWELFLAVPLAFI